VIDVHCHLDFDSFNRDREEVIRRALDRGVLMINSGIDLQSNRRCLSLFRDLEGIWITLGQSPNDLRDLRAVEKNLEFIEKHVEELVAIGEIGLDFYRERNERKREIQRDVFWKFLKLAEKLDKPIVIHARNAEREAFEMLPEGIRAMFHCYSGSPELAKEIADKGHLISISTLVCFSKKHEEIVRELGRGFVVETDSPFLSPRRRRNEPIYVLDAIEKIAKLKKIKEDEVSKITLKTAVRFFDL